MDKVKEILAKESWNGDDVAILIANQNLLAQKDLERLGLAPITPDLVVEEPVKISEEILKNGSIGEVEDFTTEDLPKAKKRGRKAKL